MRQATSREFTAFVNERGDGRPTRFVPVRGDAAGPYSWSPDGRLVVVQGQDSPQLVEVATGRVVRTFPAPEAYWVDADRLLYLDRETMDAVLVNEAGEAISRQELPEELSGRYVSVAPR